MYDVTDAHAQLRDALDPLGGVRSTKCVDGYVIVATAPTDEPGRIGASNLIATVVQSASDVDLMLVGSDLGEPTRGENARVKLTFMRRGDL